MSWACIRRMGIHMTRYSWMIHTADEETDEGAGDVYLSLQGLKASTLELKLPRRNFAGGTVEAGIIEVRRDLGELQTGSLRTEDSARSLWTSDWIRVVNLSDGRQWTAQGVACDLGGSCSLLQFERTRDPIELEKSKGDRNQHLDDADRESREGRATDEGRGEMKPERSRDDRSCKNAGPVVRTYELFGRHKGRLVSLAAVLRIRAGSKQLTPGAQVLVTDQESQGFGLGGEPGLWQDMYPGVDPTLYGLDADRPILASDGSRGWVVDAHYLAMIFGAHWRRVVYGN